MKVLEAINESNSAIAEDFSPLRKQIVVAMGWGPRDMAGKFRDARIIESCTDPTVVRRLRLHEMESSYWVPWNSRVR